MARIATLHEQFSCGYSISDNYKEGKWELKFGGKRIILWLIRSLLLIISWHFYSPGVRRSHLIAYHTDCQPHSMHMHIACTWTSGLERLPLLNLITSKSARGYTSSLLSLMIGNSTHSFPPCCSVVGWPDQVCTQQYHCMYVYTHRGTSH